MDSPQKILTSIIERHREICDCEGSALQESFIDKRKYEDLLNGLPDAVLSKLSMDDFRSGIERMMDLDKQKVAIRKLGDVFYVISKYNSSKIPIIYDLLCSIFSNTNQNTRLKLFHTVMEDYYNVLTSRLLSSHTLTKTHFDRQVKFFLPFAKLEALYQQCKLGSNNENMRNAALELEEYILYPQLLREDCYGVLQNIYKTDDYILSSYEVSSTQDLPGHMGKYFQVRIIATVKEKIDVHQLFMKIIDSGNDSFDELRTCLYKKEKAFFQRILPRFIKAGMEDLTEISPKCYLATDDMVILQDVAISGYKSWDYYKTVSYEWLTASVKVLAKMHAASIVYEEKTSKLRGKEVRLDEEFEDELRNITFDEDKEKRMKYLRHALCDYLPTKLSDVIREVPLENLMGELNLAFNKMNYIGEKSEKYRNVLSHGDMWCANVMCKMDENNKVVSAYFIDFQLVRYCSPAVDLLFLIHSSSSRSLRRLHMPELLQLYHSELAGILTSYDIDVDNIISYETLLEACKEEERAVILKVLEYLHFILLPQDLKKDAFSDSEEFQRFFFEDKVLLLEQVWVHEWFRERIRGLYEDFVDTMVNKK